MSVRFWGARGSIPRPGADADRYGGNTCCVEVRCGDTIIIFDAGTGIRLLGNTLEQDTKAIDVDIFLSHCHIDHVIGLPFFAPLLKKDNRIHLWAGNLLPEMKVKDAINRLLSFPLFPIGMEAFQATIECRDFRAGDVLNPRPGVVLQTAPLRHPGRATGYRLEFGGRSIAYLTDTECGDASIDQGIVGLAKNADLMIIDATYTDNEIPSHSGWGHSSWQQCARLADAANAKRLCLFHHDPDHDDVFLDEVALAAQTARPGTLVAREGMRIDL
jgi:phosphoribosyl 1,2-cyclic phosphodiesterase